MKEVVTVSVNRRGLTVSKGMKNGTDRSKGQAE